MDKAMLELENVNDLMSDHTFADGWVLCKLCVRIGNSLVTRYLERKEVHEAVQYLRKVDKALSTWDTRLKLAYSKGIFQGNEEEFDELSLLTRLN